MRSFPLNLLSPGPFIVEGGGANFSLGRRLQVASCTLHIASCRMLVVALSLLLVECQLQSSTPPISDRHLSSATRNQQSETLPAHPLSGLSREQIFLIDDSGNSREILAEIANEPQAQERGLMFRESLSPSEGMLFVFPKEAPRGFWMKNTLIPLDILFFDAQGGWISGATMTPCKSDLCPSYSSGRAAKYALELPAGFLVEHGTGWELKMKN